ncbi:MAG: tetratricopeptide repeat protein [Treponema sp.]|nr:tetratricopeptide repeat protein [Treponema sp.]
MSDITKHPQEREGAEGEQDARMDISVVSKAGYKLLRENKLAEARERFQSILAIDPANNYALVGLGDAARKQGDSAQAIALYQRCLESHPGNTYALFGLADCFKALDRHEEAIKAWEKYLESDSGNITVLTRVANAYRKIKDFAKAKAAFMRVLEIEPDNPYAITGLGHLHYDFKEYREALSYWDRMTRLSLKESDVRVLTSIGNCHRKLKTFAEGVQPFELVLKREPRNFYAIFGLADCYRGMSRHGDALRYWKLLLEQEPDNKEILTRSGDAHRSMGELEVARDFYDRALAVGFDVYAALGIALVSKERRDFLDASQRLRVLLAREPSNQRVVAELVSCLIKLGERQEALDTLKQFQSANGPSAQITEMLQRI